MKLLVLLGCVLLVGCGADSADPPTATTTPAQTTATAPPASTTTTATTTPPREVKSATSGGITLRVLTVRSAPTVKLLATADAKAQTRTAKPSEHFVYVTTRVTNNTRVGLDLGCGVPVRTVLVDSRNRTFEPIKGLSQLKHNPTCNAQLQPGSRDRMTWVFLTPRSTKLSALAFTDFTDTSKPGPFRQIPL